MGLYDEIINANKKKKEAQKSSLFDEIINASRINSANQLYEAQKKRVENINEDYQRDISKGLANTGIYNTGSPKRTDGTDFVNSVINKEQKTTQSSPFNIEENAKKIQEALYNPTTNEEREKLNKEKNTLKYNRYLKTAEDVSNEKTNWWDKTGGVVQRAISDLFENFSADEYKYKDEEGNTKFLPTYNQLKQEKVSGDYDTKVGKFLGDVGYQGTKILGSTALNAIVPGSGSVLYWTDMTTDSYKDAINQGYDTTNSAAYALANAGFEYATSKILGGATGKLTGGSARELDKAASNVFYKLTGNETVSRILGTAFSEGTEEFTQEYLDNISKLLLLENSTDLGEYANIFKNPEILEDALYSAAVGAATGGAIETTNGSDVNRNVKLFENFKEQIEERKANTTDKAKIEQYDKVIESIDSYLKKPFSIETETTENVQNQVQQIDDNPLAKLQRTNIEQRQQINQQVEQELQQEQIDNMSKKIDKLSKQVQVQNENAKGTPFNTLIGYGNDTALVQVKGDLQNINGVDVGIYKDSNGNWHVVDLQSNFSFDRGSYSTKKAAIENATDAINNFDLSQLRQNKEQRKAEAIDLTTKNKPETKNEYRGSHQIENAKKLVDLNINDIQSRVEELNGYLTQQDQIDLRKLNKIFNHPEEDIKVYRASPVNELNSGDWITTDKAYAKNVAQNNGGKVYEYTIKPSQLYYPNNVNDLPSLHRLSSFQYIENQPSIPTTRDFNKINLPTRQKVSSPTKSTTEAKTSPVEPKMPSSKDVKTTSIPMVKNNESLRVESQRIANEINKNETFKQKGWLKTATNSDVLKDSGLIKDLDPSQLNYVVQSNKSSVDKANNTIETLGYEKSLDKVKQIINDDKLPSASDVALMQRMIQEAAKRGDAATVQDLIMDTAIVGTDLGQATQALSIIQRLTPEGQLKLYTKLVQRAKVRGEKSFQNVEITPEMVENVLGAYNSDGTYDQDDLNARVEQFKQDLANQMKSTAGDKVNAWRYLAMLGNPKTHIRNIVSNVAMSGTIKVKNAMARTLETILPVEERTKTWKPASQDVKEFAKQTTEEIKGVITGESKYNEKTAIESKKQIFKFKPLETLSNKNGDLLEGADWFFSSRAFKSTLQEYLTANNINTKGDIQNNPEIVQKAINYSVEQAQIATFRQYSKLAATINQIEKKNKGAKVAVQALMPFKKTPINVAKAGAKYSPLGLIKSLSYDAYQLKQGNINASQFIDNLSQGLTGTSLTILGYALAKAGFLTGSGDDDKEGKYDSQLGNTGYSLNINGKSYSISWLSPVAMPMLVGANAYEQLEEGKDWDMNVVSDTLAKTLDPLNEMSFMQGLTNALQSYGSGTDKIKGSLESTAQNYVGQFFPTIFSQLASTLDDKKRSTKASNDSKYKFGEQTVRSIMYKIPGLRQKLEATTDIWGNEKEQSDNIIERAFESFIAPYSKTKKIETDLDKEIKRVYNETGETGVIPGIPNSYVKYKNETYRMSANEYTDYKKTYGQNANKYLNNLIESNSYKNASDEIKAKMINNVYDYAKAEANEEYFKNNNIDYINDELKELQALREEGITGKQLANYVADKTQISSIRSDNSLSSTEKKNKVLDVFENSNLNNDQLSYLYSGYYSTEEKVRAINNVNIPIKEFIKYDLQDFESDYNANTGKTINNSKKNKVINYINNNLKLSSAQKALLIKLEYNTFKGYDDKIVNYIKSSDAPFLDKAYLLKKAGFNSFDKEIINYVQSHLKTAKDKEEVLKNMGFTVRNGRVYK